MTELKFNGESWVAIFLQLIVLVPLFGIILIAVFLSFGTIGKLVMVLLLFFVVVYFLKKGIKSVLLGTDHVVVNHFSGNSEVYHYVDFQYFEFRNQTSYHPSMYIGNIDRKICVVKFKDQRTAVKKSKIYFYCPPEREKELNDFLAIKNLKITQE
ncbi:MAG: hypothetical protein PHQ74_01405 [Crocinitomicaceae bacterium]|nr:hypothetical protein [Crocinitomicaceae bacterium]